MYVFVNYLGLASHCQHVCVTDPRLCSVFCFPPSFLIHDLSLNMTGFVLLSLITSVSWGGCSFLSILCSAMSAIVFVNLTTVWSLHSCHTPMFACIILISCFVLLCVTTYCVSLRTEFCVVKSATISAQNDARFVFTSSYL